MMLSKRPHQSLFGDQRSLVKGSSDPDSHHHGRTRIRPGIFNSLQNKILDSFNTRGRLEHAYGTHIFTAEALRRYGNFDRISRNDLRVQHGRCVVSCVSSSYRIPDDGFSQEAFFIAAPYALVHRLRKAAARQMHVLADLQKHAGHPGILADGHFVRIRDLKVLDDIVQHSPGKIPAFLCPAGADALLHILRKMHVCFDAQPFYGVRQLPDVYFSHRQNPFVIYCCKL